MSLSDRLLIDALSRTPFVDSTELAAILGEPHATIHRILSSLLTDGIVGRVSHGTVYLPSPRGDLNRPCRLAVTRRLQSPQPHFEDSAIYRPPRPTNICAVDRTIGWAGCRLKVVVCLDPCHSP